MSKQVINIGTAANDASGDPLRIAFTKANENFTELYNAVQDIESNMLTVDALVRSRLAATCNGTAGQVISFSTEFVTGYALSIIDYEGIGIEVTAQDEDGFTITSLSAGNFGYIAMVEV